MPPQWCGSNTTLYILRACGLLGAIGSGLYTTFMVMYAPASSDQATWRWKVIYFYLAFFSVAITSAELDLLRHPAMQKYGNFLTSFTGRAILYVFIGGLLLHEWGFVPGCFMLFTAGLNIVAQCFCPKALRAGQPQKQDLDDPNNV
jgi:hypothetical protein